MTEKNKPLVNDALVYRAIKSKKWIQEDGRLLPVAFFRMPEKDSDGLSVSQSAENCTKLLNKIRKVARIKVAEIRSAKRINGALFNLDVVTDPVPLDPLHALITNLPYYYGADLSAGLEAAEAIIASPSLSIIDVAMSAA